MSINALLELRRIFGRKSVHEIKGYYQIFFRKNPENLDEYEYRKEEYNASRDVKTDNIPMAIQPATNQMAKALNNGGRTVFFYCNNLKQNFIKIKTENAETPEFVDFLRDKDDYFFYDPLIIPTEDSDLELDGMGFMRAVIETLNSMGKANWVIYHDDQGLYYVTEKLVSEAGGASYMLREVLGHDEIEVFDGASIVVIPETAIREEHLPLLRELSIQQYLEVVQEPAVENAAAAEAPQPY